jgi:hypothetical protein
MKKLNIFFSVIIVLGLVLGLLLPLVSNAQPNPEGGGSTYKIEIPNPLKVDEEEGLPGLLNWIIDEAIIPIGGIIAALMIMYAGFMYVTARGNDTQIKKAHDALLYAAIGSGVLLGAKVIAEAIKGTVDQIR